MARFLALYLPQFHPIPENDVWYGKGFTDWRNVAAARPLYPGHYQPHIPADLGFYDLRLKDTVRDQVKLARAYGVDGFLYWHYWFGNGRQLLESPFHDVVKDKSLDIGFAAAWGNASWDKKQWGEKGQNKRLIEQQYLGEEDYKAHFYSLLEAFRDQRYIRIDDKPIFVIYQPMDSDEIPKLINVWRMLAQKEGIGDIYFIGHVFYGREREKLFSLGFDAVYDDNMLNIHHRKPEVVKAFWAVLRNYFHIPTVFDYKKAIKYMILEADFEENVFPTIVPNWDHTPRTGAKNIMFKNCDPRCFQQLTENAIHAIRNKQEDHQIVFIKSWNEWAEGNHMEPDLRYGRGYLEALKQARAEAHI